MSFSNGLDTGTIPRFITLEVSALSHIIITALNGLQDTHLGHQVGRLKEALIENRIKEDMELCMGRTVYGKQAEYDPNGLEGIADPETIYNYLMSQAILNNENKENNDTK